MTGYGVPRARARGTEGRGAAAHKRSGLPAQVRYDACDTERDTCDVTLRDTPADGDPWLPSPIVTTEGGDWLCPVS